MLQKRNYFPLYIFLISWFTINIIQSAFIGVDGDEAYYWMFSKQIDWGFFDHPPLVALLIKWGESFGHRPIFTRLGTVIITTASAWIIFIGLPDRLRHTKYFVLLFSSILIINVYGFITTPDAPLFFFSSLFFLGYRLYLEKDNFIAVLLLSFAITGMFYSKYHGILPVIFVVLSNFQLLKRGSFWCLILIVIVLYSPHIYWQYQHDWPTVRFHLFERGLRIYKINFTLDYIFGQLLIWGPIISFFFYFNVIKIRSVDKLIKAHIFNFWSVLIIFLLSSFKNHVEAHWTLVAGTSFIVLFMEIIHKADEKRKFLFIKLAKINIGLMLTLRILLLVPGLPIDKINNYKPFIHGKSWADSIYKYAGTTPVIFTDSYILPSIYQYYQPNATAIGYNTKYYRKTQYSINHSEQDLNGKNVLWFNDEISDANLQIVSPFKSGNLIPINNYCAVNDLKIEAIDLPVKIQLNDTIDINLKITNLNNDAIINDGRLSISYSFSKYSYVVSEGANTFQLPKGSLSARNTITIPVKIIAPKEKGLTRLLFSINNGLLKGNFASPYYNLEVL